MKCECGTDMRATESRRIEQGVWRVRRCSACEVTFTTLEQKCETVKAPYRSCQTGKVVEGIIKAPPVPEVPRPNPPEKRAVALRPPVPAKPPKPPKVMRDLEKDKIKAPWAPAPVEHRVQFAPRMPERPPVDQVTPTARDRIEDMKFEREQSDYGWDTK